MDLEKLLKRLIEIYKEKGNIEVCAFYSEDDSEMPEELKIESITLPDNSYDKAVFINLKEF